MLPKHPCDPALDLLFTGGGKDSNTADSSETGVWLLGDRFVENTCTVFTLDDNGVRFTDFA
ncbi:hypothetical protein LXA43DRAFT_1094709 [Ganoderma leucocontextum]|nr:hypothetical protein LXA43DRAFT_1094709 [Ganoderma leucocontextum]